MGVVFQRGYLRAGGQDIYAGLYSPEAEGPVAHALVFAEPFGEEKRCAARMLVRLARSLAAERRCAVLKFDFSGTGDSSGEHAQATVRQWVLELRTAAGFLLARFPGAALALAGLRAGALWAGLAADKLPAARLLLLSPILSGKELQAGLDRRRRMKDLLMGREDGPEDGDFGGIAVGPRMLAELASVDLLECLERLPAGCRIHLLHTTGAPGFPAPWKPLTEFLRRREGSALALLRDRPFWGQLEYYESDLVRRKVEEWLHD